MVCFLLFSMHRISINERWVVNCMGWVTRALHGNFIWFCILKSLSLNTLVTLWKISMCRVIHTSLTPPLYTPLVTAYPACAADPSLVGLECCSLCLAWLTPTRHPGREHASRGVQLGTGNKEFTNSTFVFTFCLHSPCITQSCCAGQA